MVNPYERERRQIELERRQQPRYSGSGVMAKLDGKLVDVVDISLSGLQVRAVIAVSTDPVAVTLFPREGDKLDLNHAIRVLCIPVRSAGDCTGMQFQRSTMALSRLIIKLMSEQLGVAPYFVR
jgi:hypothetical protein